MGEVLAEVIAQTQSLNLFTDGERRYGNLLFDICHQAFHFITKIVPAVKLGIMEVGLSWSQLFSIPYVF